MAFHHALGVTVLYGHSVTFLRQPGMCSRDYQEAVDVTAEVQRFHITYITTIGLPWAALPANEMYDQAIHALLNAFNLLWMIDPSFLICVSD